LPCNRSYAFYEAEVFTPLHKQQCVSMKVRMYKLQVNGNPTQLNLIDEHVSCKKYITLSDLHGAEYTSIH